MSKEPFIEKWISIKSYRNVERRHIYIEISKMSFIKGHNKMCPSSSYGWVGYSDLHLLYKKREKITLQ